VLICGEGHDAVDCTVWECPAERLRPALWAGLMQATSLLQYPPSSRVQGFRFRPAVAPTSRPTSVEPVNTT
jgi:hypothetical protein